MTKYERRPIKAHSPWLVREMPNRGKEIAGLMVHITASGKKGNPTECSGTENWWNNPTNKHNDTPDWGSYADMLFCASGTQIVCTDTDTEYAAWTAGYGAAGTGTWPAGMHYIQCELAIGTIHEEFPDAMIDSFAQYAAEQSLKYDFPLTRIAFLKQVGEKPRGICTHEDSANGKVYGKQDPGPMFPWDTFLAKAKGYRQAEAPVDMRDVATRLTTLEDTSEAQWRGYHIRQDLQHLATGKWSEVEASHKLLSLADFVPKR